MNELTNFYVCQQHALCVYAYSRKEVFMNSLWPILTYILEVFDKKRYEYT